MVLERVTPLFECAVVGVPKSPASGSRRAWQETVRSAVRRTLDDEWRPLAVPVSAVIVYFHSGYAKRIDVDNMAKPILDALTGEVLVDDGWVDQLVARRTRLHAELEIRDASQTLAQALEEDRDFVLIRINDAPDHGVIP